MPIYDDTQGLTEPVRVLLVDGQLLVRQLLAEFIDNQVDIRVVGAVENTRAALESVDELRPHVIALSVESPGLSAFSAAEQLGARAPTSRVLLYSTVVYDERLHAARQAKVAGYLTKDESPAQFAAALKSVAAGQEYFSPSLHDRLARFEARRSVQDANGTPKHLTPRETEVLCYIASGLAKKEIAETMSLSPKTIEKHSENLMRKLDIHDRVHLTRYAIRQGLTEA